MQESVSIDKALQRGHEMLSYPVWIIMFGCLGICFYLGIKGILSKWIIPIGFVLAFVLGWLYWSFMVTRWRLWAFENVRNVHELKKRAVLEKLIWPDNSIFEKTEIRTSSQKFKWDLLKNKFSIDDVFIEDLSIPNETLVFYSKDKSLFLVKTKSPQIILNAEGIYTIFTGFYKWSEIENDLVESIHGRHGARHYLNYKHPKGNRSLDITNLDIDFKYLAKLLHYYREKGNSNKL
jgi:hypothetical protein